MSNVATVMMLEVMRLAFEGNLTLNNLVWTRICKGLIIPQSCERLPAIRVWMMPLDPAATPPTTAAV